MKEKAGYFLKFTPGNPVPISQSWNHIHASNIIAIEPVVLIMHLGIFICNNNKKKKGHEFEEGPREVMEGGRGRGKCNDI